MTTPPSVRPEGTGAHTRVRLYIAGSAPNSSAARRNLSAYLATHPRHPVDVEIIDVLKNPERALADKILVTPTLIRLSPRPEQRVVGDLRNEAALAAGLELGGLDDE